MTTDEAAALIDALADSLEREPNQFNFAVSISSTGTRIESQGGTGLNVSVEAGAPGSSAIGFQSSAHVDRPSVEIKAAAEAAATEALRETIGVLRELADATRQHRDGGKIRALIERLHSASLAPAMLVETVENALSLADVVT